MQLDRVEDNIINGDSDLSDEEGACTAQYEADSEGGGATDADTACEQKVTRAPESSIEEASAVCGSTDVGTAPGPGSSSRGDTSPVAGSSGHGKWQLKVKLASPVAGSSSDEDTAPVAGSNSEDDGAQSPDTSSNGDEEETQKHPLLVDVFEKARVETMVDGNWTLKVRMIFICPLCIHINYMYTQCINSDVRY